MCNNKEVVDKTELYKTIKGAEERFDEIKGYLVKSVVYLLTLLVFCNSAGLSLVIHSIEKMTTPSNTVKFALVLFALSVCLVFCALLMLTCKFSKIEHITGKALRLDDRTIQQLHQKVRAIKTVGEKDDELFESHKCIWCVIYIAIGLFMAGALLAFIGLDLIPCL